MLFIFKATTADGKCEAHIFGRWPKNISNWNETVTAMW